MNFLDSVYSVKSRVVNWWNTTNNNTVPAQPVVPNREAPRVRLDARIQKAVQRPIPDQLEVIRTVQTIAPEGREAARVIQVDALNDQVKKIVESDPILATFGKMGRGIEDAANYFGGEIVGTAKYLGREIEGTAKYLDRQVDSAIRLISCS